MSGFPKETSVADSILAKFQQVNRQKEEASKPKETTVEQSSNCKRKLIDEVQLHKGISEEDVGITEYMSDHAGFKGILKHRFGDFQVHEIDPAGNIMELNNCDVPSADAVDSHQDVSDSEKQVLPQESWDKLDEIVKNGSDEVLELDVSTKEKSERTMIHKTVKKIYGSQVFSNTKTTGESTVIKIGKATNKERNCWPQHLPTFLHFTVCKTNMDTTNFVYLISKKLRLKSSLVTYAGTKDRRGVTTQRMCVKRRTADELAKVSLWGAQFGNYQYQAKPLRLGDLSGNRFTITIRNVEADDDQINDSLEKLNENGFINYFGLQRFGSSVVAPTYEIGKAILKRDWKLAVELILRPRPDEKTPVWLKEALQAWSATGNPSEAMKYFGKRQDSIEFWVLKTLKVCSTDYHAALMKINKAVMDLGKKVFAKALKSIPRNTLLLYLHSYQSWVWNKVVSRRVAKYGKSRLIVGDLVLEPTSHLESQEDNRGEGEEAGKGEDQAEEKEEELPEDEHNKVESRSCTQVRVLSEEDLNTTSIYELVYPLPGHDVQYPKNEIALWYEEILKADNISPDELKSNNKLFSLYGAYRTPFLKVGDLTWRIIRHQNFDDDFVLTDTDELKKVILPPHEGDAHKSVVVELSLKPSTYATMALRELMKINTSVSHHASLTRDRLAAAAEEESAVKRAREEGDLLVPSTNGDMQQHDMESQGES